MLVRGMVLVLVGILLNGCAGNEPAAALRAVSSGLASTARAAEAGGDPSRKTLASKVLGAIALERVTGRKTDPSRLTQLN
jgi:hypothetical protein